MKNGIIYNNWMIIEDENNLQFIKNWKNKFKNISKNFLISNQNTFLKHLSKISTNNKVELEIETNKILQIPPQLTFQPKISIILASLNSHKTIKNAIISIIKQNYNNIELIVIDDGSTDNNVEVIEKLKKHYTNRISDFKIIKNSENKGVYYSRNIGIKNSTGDFIAIQDADDISDKNRLIISLYELINNNVEFILSNYTTIDKLDKFSSIRVAMASLFVRRDFYDRYGYYDEGTRHSGDLEILDRAYYVRYGYYEGDNFWDWLNNSHYREDFYYHIYENLYYVGETDGITSKNNAAVRREYLVGRREKNKMLGKGNGKLWENNFG